MDKNISQNPRKILLILLVVSILQSTCISNTSISYPTPTTQVHVPLSYATTRIDAIIDYILALYLDEGIFYEWLEDTPPDLRIGSTPCIYDVYDAYRVLNMLDRTNVLDWTNCTKFLRSLVNIDPVSPSYYGLVNFSITAPPTVISCDVAIELFPELSLESLIFEQEIAEYIVQAQTPDGGFRLRPDNSDPPDMITTWSALRAMYTLNRLSDIDTSNAIDFIMSCYSADGGFSNVPYYDSNPDVVPLGLFCLEYLNRFDLVRVTNTTNYLLQYWDNNTSHVVDGTLVNTERFVWSLKTLGTLNQININKTLEWVLACQNTRNGLFLPIPNYDYDSERLEWCRAAVHILDLCDRMDLLEEPITLIEHPVYTTPQWYIDYINEHFGTQTNTGNGIYPVWPNIDIAALLINGLPFIGIASIISLPGVYIILSNRKKRNERKEQRERRQKTKGK